MDMGGRDEDDLVCYGSSVHASYGSNRIYNRRDREMGKKQKAKKPVAFDTWFISMLRKACMRWPPYYNTKKEHKREVVLLRTEKDGDNHVVSYSYNGQEYSLDAKHIPKLGRRIIYQCEICRAWYLDKDYHTYKNGKRRKRTTIVVDHITPVVDPAIGFVDWDTYIRRMFPQGEGKRFQCICHACHDKKSEEERNERAQRKCRGNKKASGKDNADGA